MRDRPDGLVLTINEYHVATSVYGQPCKSVGGQYYCHSRGRHHLYDDDLHPGYQRMYGMLRFARSRTTLLVVLLDLLC